MKKSVDINSSPIGSEHLEPPRFMGSQDNSSVGPAYRKRSGEVERCWVGLSLLCQFSRKRERDSDLRVNVKLGDELILEDKNRVIFENV